MLLKKTAVVVFLFFFLSVAAHAVPDVSAQSAALIDVDSGSLLYGKNENKRLPMASTTKIMTSLLALEAGMPNKTVTVTEDMVRVEGTSMGLLPGDIVTLKTLVYGMLLESGNDAANTTANVLAGSLGDFALRMNNRAREIGMINTSFVTPSGLDDKNHFSTAYDMALLGREAIQNPDFAEICSKSKAGVEYGNPPYSRTLWNHNRLLKVYSGTTGIKTGFTKKSGRCLVSAAERDGVKLVAVTLNAPNDWNDHQKLLNYGFSLLELKNLDDDLNDLRLPVAGGKSENVRLGFPATPTAVMKKGGHTVNRQIYLKHFEYAPVNTGDIVGYAVYYENNNIICEAPIIASDSVDIKTLPKPVEKEKGFLKRLEDRISGWFRKPSALPEMIRWRITA